MLDVAGVVGGIEGALLVGGRLAVVEERVHRVLVVVPVAQGERPRMRRADVKSGQAISHEASTAQCEGVVVRACGWRRTVRAPTEGG